MSDLKSIVHVDDDTDILEITRMALQLVDTFDLHQFSSSVEALGAIVEIKPDLLLLDVMMPDLTGPELWEKVRRHPKTEGMPAIFMTAKAEDQLSTELLSRGALDVVTKPFDPMTLGAQIREAWALTPTA